MKKIIGYISAVLILLSSSSFGQSFDFNLIEEKLEKATCIIDMKIEYSFGVHRLRFMVFAPSLSAIFLIPKLSKAKSMLNNKLSDSTISTSLERREKYLAI